jgi:hypothetical protein
MSENVIAIVSQDKGRMCTFLLLFMLGKGMKNLLHLYTLTKKKNHFIYVKLPKDSPIEWKRGTFDLLASPAVLTSCIQQSYVNAFMESFFGVLS